jgi:hypothetical protein
MKTVKHTCPLGHTCQTEDENEIVRCHWYIQVRGKSPQTGESVDEWGCSLAWLPVLLIEGSQQTRQAGAAIESFRNEVVSGTIRPAELKKLS